MPEIATENWALMLQELEAALKVLQAQYGALATGVRRFEGSLEALEQTRLAKSAQVLVPMTSSVYQEGTLIDSDRFVVDIGAGYYVERSYAAQKKYFQKRIASLNDHLKQIGTVIAEKKAVRDQCAAILRRKQQQPAQPVTATA